MTYAFHMLFLMLVFFGGEANAAETSGSDTVESSDSSSVAPVAPNGRGLTKQELFTLIGGAAFLGGSLAQALSARTTEAPKEEAESSLEEESSLSDTDASLEETEDLQERERQAAREEQLRQEQARQQAELEAERQARERAAQKLAEEKALEEARQQELERQQEQARERAAQKLAEEKALEEERQQEQARKKALQSRETSKGGSEAKRVLHDLTNTADESDFTGRVIRFRKVFLSKVQIPENVVKPLEATSLQDL